MPTRRDVLLATGALCFTGAAAAHPNLAEVHATLKGGRLGVAALDTASGHRLSLAPDARFAHCSVFKLPLAAAVLARVDAGTLALDESIHFGVRDLFEHAPVVRAHLPEGVIAVGTLCEAVVTVSDNAAANLLLPLVGGPAGLTRWVRGQGDAVTRFDRTEPTLNTNLPGDPRDTTTPAAMVALMRRLLVGDALTPVSRARLAGWTAACTTGAHRLRAGFPAEWRAGDKTGTGERGAANDVAIALPTGARAPLLIACFVDAPAVDLAVREAAMAAIGRLAAARLIA